MKAEAPKRAMFEERMQATNAKANSNNVATKKKKQTM
jgi:hypothetical protein